MLRFVAAVSAFLLFVPPFPAADWAQFRGPDRENRSPDKGLLPEWPKDGPPLAWKCEGIGRGFSSVAVVGDKVFTMGDLNDAAYLFAIDRQKGGIVWKAKVGKTGGNYEGPRCTPTVADGLVYALGQFGDLVCADAASGEEKWRKSFPKDFKGQSGSWNFTESPLVDGEQVVCTPGGKDHTLVALERKTGKLIWKCGFDATAGYSSIMPATIAGTKTYVQLLADGVAGVSAKDGKLLWRYGDDGEHFAGNTANIPTAVVLGDQVFQAAGYGRGAGLISVTSKGAEFTVKEEWFKRELSNKHGGVTRVGDHLYADREDSGSVQCVDFKTGKVLWSRPGPKVRDAGRGSTSLTYADGHLYLHFDNGYMALAEATPKGYVERGTFKLPNATGESWAHPVVIDGKLYQREQDTLWVHDVKAR